MGSCGAKSTHNEVIQPQNNRQQRIHTQYAQFMRLDHPLNVNHKYTAFFKVIPEHYTGEGIKKTNQYQSRLSREEWLQKRQEFWETRTEGNQEAWNAIKTACENDEQTAIAILSAAELKLVNRSLQIVYDLQGQKYDVPVFCINEPVSFTSKHSSEMGIKQNFDSTQIKVKVRCTKFTHDLEFELDNQTTVSELKRQLQQSQPEVQKVRFFYGGRELQDHHHLGNYNLPQQPVLQAFCT